LDIIILIELLLYGTNTLKGYKKKTYIALVNAGRSYYTGRAKFEFCPFMSLQPTIRNRDRGSAAMGTPNTIAERDVTTIASIYPKLSFNNTCTTHLSHAFRGRQTFPSPVTFVVLQEKCFLSQLSLS